jgi:hypothetical protein
MSFERLFLENVRRLADGRHDFTTGPGRLRRRSPHGRPWLPTKLQDNTVAPMNYCDSAG